MPSGSLYFDTNRSWATVRVDYHYNSSTFYVDDVSVLTEEWATNRVIDGYIKLNGITIDSGGQQYYPSSLNDYYSLGVSGSCDTTSTVTISFHKNSYSAWFGVTSPSTAQYSISDGTSKSVKTSDDDDDDGGDSGGGSNENIGYVLYFDSGGYSWDYCPPRDPDITKWTNQSYVELPQPYKNPTSVNIRSFTITGDANSGDNNTSITAMKINKTSYTFNG